MKKRGSVSISTFIVTIMAVLVLGTMIYIFLADDGVFPGAKENVDSFKEEYLTLNDDFNLIILSKSKISSEKTNKEYDSFILTMEKMLESEKTNCFSNFGGFSHLGEKGTKISLVYDHSSGKTTIVPYQKQKKIISKKSKQLEMVPCVIAGTGGVTKNWYNHFIKKEQESLSNHYYNPVTQIDFFYSEDGVNGNVIKVPEFGSQYSNDNSNNFKSDGWLFKPKKGVVCVFPTQRDFLVGPSEGGLSQVHFRKGGGANFKDFDVLKRCNS